MVSSAGQGDAVHGKQPKHRLSDVLKESYQNIQDLYDAKPHNSKIIVIDDKTIIIWTEAMMMKNL